MRVLATLSSMLVLLAAPAFAQSGNPGFMTLGTGPRQPNNSDRVFVHAAAAIARKATATRRTERDRNDMGGGAS